MWKLSKKVKNEIFGKNLFFESQKWEFSEFWFLDKIVVFSSRNHRNMFRIDESINNVSKMRNKLP